MNDENGVLPPAVSVPMPDPEDVPEEAVDACTSCCEAFGNGSESE